MENSQEQNTSTSLLKIEVDDMSNYFISYWNLALKKLLPNYFCFINSDTLGQIKLPLSSLNIKLVNINNTLENIFEDKLFLIKIYFVNSEKDLTRDYFNNIKNSYVDKNLNLIMISTDEIKKESNIPKECTKLLNKIKSKTGINDLFYLPYSITNLDKIKNLFNDFLNAFAYKFSKDFFVKLNLLSEKLENFEKFEIKEKEAKNNNEDDYDIIQDCIYYLDLLSQIKCWNMILSFTEKIIFKKFEFLKDKINIKLKPTYFFDFDENKLKMTYINKKLSNVDFNEYLLHHYIISSHFLQKYENINNIIKYFPEKMKMYNKYFKSEFHYLFWIINYLYIFIDYCEKLKEKNQAQNKNILFLYNLCIKYYKIYIYRYNKNKFYVPNKNILNILINNINQNNIKENIEKLFLINEKKENKEGNISEIFNDIDEDTKKNDKIFILLNDNKKILNELLNIYKSINNKFRLLSNINISLQYLFDEIYILISFLKFEEIKNIFVSLINHKYFKNKRFSYIYKYICLILLLILNYLDKNKENLNLIFKLLLTINFNNTLTDKLLKNIGCDNKNIIYEIISKYIETYDSNKNNEKEEIKFCLDTIFDINLFNRENKIIFINKTKEENNIEKIDYKITNKTGVELNIKKIVILFEEINISEKNNSNKQNNIISYEINEDKNTFKKIEPYIKQKEEFIQIEINDLFKTNHIYKPIEINFILNNEIKAIYKIKEKIEFIINEININIKAELCSNNNYYNILSLMKINLSNINEPSELSDKHISIELNNINNNGDSILKIQTELAKNNLSNIFKDIIINDNCIEFPSGSIKNIQDLNSLEIPFFIESTNYYTITSKINIEFNLHIKQSKESKENIFSYRKIFSPEFSHLFTIGKRFKKIQNKNSYLMQTFLTLNLENTTVTVYNKDETSVNIDSKQAINMILILSDKEEEIIKKLRNNYIKFSLKEKKEIIYQFCYPEKNILEEIKEMKEIPYYITISLDKNDCEAKIYNELGININIKKFKNKKSKLMIYIKENEQWSVIGRNKIIEEFDKENCEKNVKIILLPLIDGFISLPEFEFNECCDSNENKFEPIEYGSIIDGDKNVINITPLKEYTLKINLT